MTDNTDTDSGNPGSDDWLVPAILVAIVVVLALVIGIIAGVRAGDGDDSVAGQLERWSSCLRSQGANVPLVESLRDGGFRVTVDGSLVEDGIDMESLRPALDHCEDDAPEGVRKFMTLLDGLSAFPFGGFGTDVFDFDEARGAPFGRSDAAPGRSDLDRRDLAEICERIERGEFDGKDIPPRLARACKRSA